jgi:hypothetical protein
MNNLWKVKFAYIFHQPVDPVKLDIEDYFEIVKKTMDFGTIKVINLFKQRINSVTTLTKSLTSL